MFQRFLFAIALLVASSSSFGDPIIYDNAALPAVITSAVPSDANEALIFLRPTLAADDFQLSAASTTITGLRWWGLDFLGGEGFFRVTFFADSGGVTGDVIFDQVLGSVASTLSGSTFGGLLPIRSYAAEITPLTLLADTRYWFAVQNDSSEPSSFAWAKVANTGHYVQNADTTPTLALGELGFQLFGHESTAVPIPSTLWLFGMTLLLAGGRRVKTST